MFSDCTTRGLEPYVNAESCFVAHHYTTTGPRIARIKCCNLARSWYISIQYTTRISGVLWRAHASASIANRLCCAATSTRPKTPTTCSANMRRRELAESQVDVFLACAGQHFFLIPRHQPNKRSTLHAAEQQEFCVNAGCVRCCFFLVKYRSRPRKHKFSALGKLCAKGAGMRNALRGFGWSSRSRSSADYTNEYSLC